MSKQKKPVRLVLDTNVVLDMLCFSDPRTADLLCALKAGRYQCYTSQDCLDELARVCAYPKLKLTPAEQHDLVRRYRALATVFEAGSAGNAGNAEKVENAEKLENKRDTGSLKNAALPLCRDPDDQKFLILAAACEADQLVSRDQALLELAGKPTIPFSIVSLETFVENFVETVA